MLCYVNVIFVYISKFSIISVCYCVYYISVFVAVVFLKCCFFVIYEGADMCSVYCLSV